MTAQAVSSTTSPSLHQLVMMPSTSNYNNTAQHTSFRSIRCKSTGIVDPAVPSQQTSKTMYNKNMPEDGMLNQVAYLLYIYIYMQFSSLQFRYLSSNIFTIFHTF